MLTIYASSVVCSIGYGLMSMLDTQTQRMTDLKVRPGSLTERSVGRARGILSGERRRPSAYLAFAGPAVVVSIAYIDPGNFATNIQAGAKYGYGLLWVVLLANLIAMLFQALSAKLGIVTGRNLAETCRDQFPWPVVWAMWIVSEVAAMATDPIAEAFSVDPTISTNSTVASVVSRVGPGRTPVRNS